MPNDQVTGHRLIPVIPAGGDMWARSGLLQSDRPLRKAAGMEITSIR